MGMNMGGCRVRECGHVGLVGRGGEHGGNMAGHQHLFTVMPVENATPVYFQV